MPRMHSQLISFARSNDEKVITTQESQSAMVVHGQTITTNVSHQKWCKSFSKIERKIAHFNQLQSTNFLYSLSLVGMLAYKQKLTGNKCQFSFCQL